MWNEATITDMGSNLLASWITGTELNLTRAAAGTGTADNLYMMNALTQQMQDMSIVSFSRDAKTIVVKLQLEAKIEQSYKLNQIGIFGKIGSAEECLLAVFQDQSEDAIMVPPADGQHSFIYNFFATLVVNNTGTLTVNIDGGASITMETALELLAKKQDKITAYGLLWRDDDGNIREAIPGEDFSDSGGGLYGTSSTAPSTDTKQVNVDGVKDVVVGDLLVVAFEKANLSLEPTLKVNDLPETPVVSKGKNTLLAEDFWNAGDYCIFQYDGTNWVLLFRFGTYIPVSQKGVAGGVATLASDGKVLAAQLRGGYLISDTAPADKTVLWICGQIMRYYDPVTKTWKNILPTWG